MISNTEHVNRWDIQCDYCGELYLQSFATFADADEYRFKFLGDWERTYDNNGAQLDRCPSCSHSNVWITIHERQDTKTFLTRLHSRITHSEEISSADITRLEQIIKNL